MISRWARTWTPRIFLPINRLLLRIGVTANVLTVAGLVLAVLTGLCIGQNWLLAASAWLALSGLCDALDGELARLQELERQDLGQNHLGGFIDSVADHYGDFAIMLGLTWRALMMNDPVTVLLAMGALFGSLVGSHIRSRAGMLGIDAKNSGLFTRMERTLVLLFGLLTGWVIPALALLVVGNNVSALQRIGFTLREGRKG